MENNDIILIMKAISEKKIFALYCAVNALITKYDDDGIMYYDFVSQLAKIYTHPDTVADNDIVNSVSDTEEMIQSMFFDIVKCIKEDDLDQLANLLSPIDKSEINYDIDYTNEEFDAYYKSIENKIIKYNKILEEIRDFDCLITYKLEEFNKYKAKIVTLETDLQCSKQREEAAQKYIYELQNFYSQQQYNIKESQKQESVTDSEQTQLNKDSKQNLSGAYVNYNSMNTITDNNVDTIDNIDTDTCLTTEIPLLQHKQIKTNICNDGCAIL